MKYLLLLLPFFFISCTEDEPIKRTSTNKLEPEVKPMKKVYTIKLIPDNYHIRFAGKMPNGDQVFVTSALEYDSNTKTTTDYLVAYIWDSAGDFKDYKIEKLGIRDEYKHKEGQKKMEILKSNFSDIKISEINVKTFSIIYEGIEFGFIPRDEPGPAYVDLMPGSILLFTEPFNGNYDT